MIRGERLNKHGDSWFFAKSIEVEHLIKIAVLEYTLKSITIMSMY